MPNPATASKDIMLEGHEERLQTLEQGHGEVSRQVAVLSEQVNSGFSSLESKIDSVIAPVAQKLSWHLDDDKKLNEQLTTVINQVGAHGEFIANEQQKDLKRKARWAWFGKSTGSVLLVILGAVAKEVITAIWKHHTGQ